MPNLSIKDNLKTHIGHFKCKVQVGRTKRVSYRPGGDEAPLRSASYEGQPILLPAEAKALGWRRGPATLCELRRGTQFCCPAEAGTKLVEVAGVEPASQCSQVVVAADGCGSALVEVSQIGAQIQGKDWQGLVHLVKSWADLHPSLKAAILAIVNAGKEEG